MKKVTRPPRISRLTVDPRSVILKNVSTGFVPRRAVSAWGELIGRIVPGFTDGLRALTAKRCASAAKVGPVTEEQAASNQQGQAVPKKRNDPTSQLARGELVHAEVKPLDLSGIPSVIAGIIAWAVAFVVLLFFRDTLKAL